MSTILKKIIIIIGILALVLFMAVIGASWYMGAFSSVEISQKYRGPYNFVYIEHIGPYHLISAKIEKVKVYLDNHQIKYMHAAGMYIDDPSKVSESELKSYAGFLVNDSITVEEPYKFMKIPKRNVLLAKIEAHPAVAPFKIYPAYHEWLEDNKEKVIPAGPPLELYVAEKEVEVEFPIQ